MRRQGGKAARRQGRVTSFLAALPPCRLAASSFRLYFVQRGDPNSGLYLILLLILAGQLLQRHSLPPGEQIVTTLLCFVIATTIHEFMHAYTAWRLGDDTSRDLGRITLNPAMHFEPFGFFGMVMISLGYSFIGWGKPVPVNPNRFRAANFVDRKRGMALVALAGPVSNIVQATVAAISLRLAGYGENDLFNLLYGNADRGTAAYFLGWFFWVNVLLASFNMIPIPPLDGHKILVGILPNFWYPVLAPLERYGFVILFLIFFLGGRFSSSITTELFAPLQSLLIRHLL
ncbi:MAG TPA: site-2 protease family protein [Thermomicrobiales bacterium]